MKRSLTEEINEEAPTSSSVQQATKKSKDGGGWKDVWMECGVSTSGTTDCGSMTQVQVSLMGLWNELSVEKQMELQTEISTILSSSSSTLKEYLDMERKSWSFCQVWLKLKMFQKDVVLLLLQRLMDTSMEEDWKLIVHHHFQWMDPIYHVDEICHATCECISFLSSTKKEVCLHVLEWLPQLLVGCSNNNDVVISTCMELCQEQPNDYLVPCFEIFLSCTTTTTSSSSLMEFAIQSIQQIYSSTEDCCTNYAALPVLFQYLFQQQSQHEIIITTLLQQPFGSTANVTNTETKKKSWMRQEDAESLVLELLVQGFQYQANLTKVLLSHYTSNANEDVNSIIHVWCLLACAVAPHNRTKVLSIMQTFEQKQIWDRTIIQRAIEGHGLSLWRSIIQSGTLLLLADLLVQKCCSIGQQLYKSLFIEFHSKEPLICQEGMAQLCRHISSSQEGEEESIMALSVATSLPCHYLQPYSSIWWTLLDPTVLQRLSPKSLRKLFLLLFSISSSNEDDTIYIMIQKHLSLSSPQLKRIGIIGAIAMAVTKSSQQQQEEEDSQPQDNNDSTTTTTPLNPTFVEVTKVLDTVYNHCQPQSSFNIMGQQQQLQDEAMGYYFEELGKAVQSRALAHDIIQWILDRFSNDLESNYLGDVIDNSNGMMNVENALDKALLESSDHHPRGPPCELRFNLDGEEGLVYVIFVRLLVSSPSGISKLQQLCPLLRLLATCHDVRYGGEGLSEIDALLGCPLLLPKANLDVMEVSELQLYTATASLFYAANWCRELIECFIYTATFAATSTTSASQPVVTQDDIRAKIIDQLNSLVQLQEELQFLASQCTQFTPPGVSPLPPPPQLLEENDDDDNDRVQNNKSKLKRIKLKEQYEQELGKRCMDALRPLGSTVCLALGFPELSIANQQQHLKTTKTPHSSQEQILLSLGASQLKSFKVGSPMVNLLLSHLHQTLARKLENSKKKKMSAFFANRKNNQPIRDDDNDPNPYTLPNSASNDGSDSKPHSMVDQQSKGQTILNFLELCIKGNIFPALHEYLATIAEIYGGMREAKINDDIKNDHDGVMKECTCLLFRCVSVIVSCEHLMVSSKGQVFLNVIVNQLSNGGDNNHDTIKELKNKRVASSRSLFQHLSHLFELIQEIVTTRESPSSVNEDYNMDTDDDNLQFIMHGINCLNFILVCIHKSVDCNNDDCNKSLQSMKKSFSNSCHQLLQRQWNADTKKYTKSNVGTILSFYLEHYPTPYVPTNDSNFNVLSFGRMGALTNVIKDVLSEIPSTDKCKGPLPSYPTCCDKTFPFYFSNAFSYLSKEINSLFHKSSEQQQQLTVGQKLDILVAQVRLLDSLSLLTKENSHLAKRPLLLIQCKGGIAFLDKFITLAVPFLEINFEQKQEAILSIINHLQQSTRQLTSILSYAKRERDTRFNKEAPKAKKILETFIHKIKSLMRKNKVLEAFCKFNIF